CEDTNVESTNIEQTLLSLIDADEALGLDGFDDGDAIEGDYESGLEQEGFFKMLADSIDPESGIRIRYGKRITGVVREVEFTDLGNDTIIGVITKTISGNFIIVALDTADDDTIFWNKTFTTDFIRKVRFVQIDTVSSDSTDGWRINALTVGVGVTGNKVDIEKIEFFRPDGAVPLYSFEGDVTSLFIARDEIPTFEAWRSIRIEVTVTNSGPEFPFRSGETVALHYGHQRGQKGRRMMNDMGLFADGTALDNVFSALWLVHGPGRNPQNDQPLQRRTFRGFADVIDFGTLYSEDDAVNSVFWALPYRSMRGN
ncbi:MAG: hypothetical protein HQ528_10845, partial [Candidatus Marinimicrobia bacterium]|nr:hypothetical protein [Candidatus Neomarinimicrobiota bacterium]